MNDDRELLRGLGIESLIDIALEKNINKYLDKIDKLTEELEYYKSKESKENEKQKLYYNLDIQAKQNMNPEEIRNNEYELVKKDIAKAKREYFLKIHREREDRLVLKDRERMWAREEMESEISSTSSENEVDENNENIEAKKSEGLSLIKNLEDTLLNRRD
ncbi:hypothetical protein QYB48_002979 [Clostridium perfringens]|nr:hypothetical protein [Clostridium perfringens]